MSVKGDLRTNKHPRTIKQRQLLDKQTMKWNTNHQRELRAKSGRFPSWEDGSGRAFNVRTHSSSVCLSIWSSFDNETIKPQINSTTTFRWNCGQDVSASPNKLLLMPSFESESVVFVWRLVVATPFERLKPLNERRKWQRTTERAWSGVLLCLVLCWHEEELDRKSEMTSERPVLCTWLWKRHLSDI